MGKNVSSDTVVSNSTKRIGAMKKFVKNGKTEIPIGGEVMTPTGVVAVFQTSLDTQAAVTATRGEYKAALVARDEAENQRRTTDEALKYWVLNRFGAGSAEAHEFGYSARKAGDVSAEDRAKAVLLNKATRKARGTMGKREKEKIKGTLDVSTAPAAPATNVAAPVTAPVVVAPAATPAATSTAVTPAVNAPAAGGNA